MNIGRLSGVINYEAGVKRFVGNAVIYEKLLKSFLNDTVLERASASFEKRDTEQLIKDVHEVKGVSGNMDMTILYRTSSALVALIRSKTFSDAELLSAFEEFTVSYIDVKNAITAAIQG